MFCVSRDRDIGVKIESNEYKRAGSSRAIAKYSGSLPRQEYNFDSWAKSFLAEEFLAIRKSYLQITASFPAPITSPQDDIFFLTHILKVNFSFLPAVNGIISKKRH